MKLKTFLIIAAVVVLLVILILVNLKKPTDKVAAAAAKQSVPPTGSGTAIAIGTPNDKGQKMGYAGKYVNSTLMLHKGIVAPDEVKELQTILNTAYPAGNLVVDGQFGDLTQAALLKVYGTAALTLEQAWLYFVKNYKDVVETKGWFSTFTGIKLF